MIATLGRGGLLAALALAGSISAAQDPTGTFQALSLEPGAAVPVEPDLDLPRPIPTDVEVSEAMRLEQVPIVELADGRVVELPLRLPFLLSEDRRTLLQYGDALLSMHPVRFDIFWIGEDGGVITEVRNRFDGQTQIDLSADGYAAVAGAPYLVDQPSLGPAQPSGEPIRVQVFDPRGGPLANEELPPDRGVNLLAALPEGRGAALATAARGAPLGRNALVLVGRDGLREAEAAELGLLQKLVALDADRMLVQGADGYGLLDVPSGRLVWSVPERIRLVGPRAAALGADRGTLLLVTGDRRGDAARYAWTVTILDLRTGAGLGQAALEGDWPGAPGQVFESIEPGSVTLQLDGARQTVAIRPPG